MRQSNQPQTRLSRRTFVTVAFSAGAAAFVACSPAAPSPTQAPQPPKPAAAPTEASKPAAPAAPGTAPAPKATVQPAAKPAPTRKLADTVTFANNAMAATFDPAYSLSNSGFMMARQIYDALVTFAQDGSGKLEGQLASDWKRIDNLTTEFKLKDNVKFSNGEDFTAESVKWTIDRLMASKNPNHASTRNRVGELQADIVNSTTVRIKTKEPDPILPNKLVSLFMLPPKFGAQAGDDGIAKQGVGTGSFKGTSMVPGQRMQLDAWEGCWRGASKVKQARVLQFNDEAGMHAGLRTGDIDIIWRIEPDQVDSIKNEANFRVQSYGSATAFSILQDTHPAMADRRVRQALNMAINKDEFVSKLMLGRAETLQGQLIEKGILGYHDGLKPIPYDPERAKALLREAGHPNIQLTMGSSVGIRSIVEGVSGYLQAIGVGSKINVYESAVYTRHGTQGTTDNTHARNWDYFHTWDYDVFGVGLVLQQPQPHFPNPEFKALYLQSRSEVDPEKRGALIKKMSEILHDEAGVLFLFVRQLVSPHTRKIERIAPSFDTAVYLWQVEKEA